MMLSKLFVEFIGTFIFLSVIISQGTAIPIGLALAAVIYFGGNISGGHFNPAVSIMQFMNGKINMLTLILYIVVQVVAAFFAYVFYKSNK